MPLADETIVKLRQVADHIMEEPLRLSMSEWASKSAMSPCGTVACIAGWTLLLDSKEVISSGHTELIQFLYYDNDNGPQRSAMNALKISYEQAQRLFHICYWPAGFRSDYKSAFGEPALRAQITRDRIEHFIATDGAE